MRSGEAKRRSSSEPDGGDDVSGSSDADGEDPEDAEEYDEEMDTALTGDELMSIDAEVWEALTVDEQDLIQGLVHAKEISANDARNRIRAFLHGKKNQKRRTYVLRRS